LKIVILDRDGVINEDSDSYIKSAEEWNPIPGSLNAIATLSAAGYLVLVATNQSGIGRGLFDVLELARIHHKMCSMVEDCGGKIDGVFYCPHLPSDNCSCRKPQPGLLETIMEEFCVDLAGCPYVGDSLKDIQLAKSMRCVPILVKTGKGLSMLESAAIDDLKGVLVFKDLGEAARHILGNTF
jgi:D-glycero-D-manno-heptose 1,7-bisphosphate phosphatase